MRSEAAANLDAFDEQPKPKAERKGAGQTVQAEDTVMTLGTCRSRSRSMKPSTRSRCSPPSGHVALQQVHARLEIPPERRPGHLALALYGTPTGQVLLMEPVEADTLADRLALGGRGSRTCLCATPYRLRRA